MSNISQPTLSRRNFLAGAAASLVGLAGATSLAGCAPAAKSTEETDLAATGAEPTLKEPTETREADIVIVGSGAAGCFAAYEAAKSGVGNILVVTKSGNATDSNFNEITGTASVETAALKEAGETFTVENMYQRMINYAHWTVNARLLHECVKLLPSNIDIFDEMGVETMVLGDRYNFGFLNVHGFTEKNKGVNFEESLQALGVEFLYDAPATAILMEDGVATGVQCESGKDVINVNAKAVLVCTGGYLANEEKVAAEYGGCKVVNMGSLNNTGDGERIVLAAGGEATLHEKRYYAIFSENTVNAMKDSPYYQSIGARPYGPRLPPCSTRPWLTLMRT